MLREFAALIEMWVKSLRAYMASNIFFIFVFPLAIILSFGFVAAGPFKQYIVSGTITMEIALMGITGVAQSIGWDRERGHVSLILAAGIPEWAYAISVAAVNGLAAIGSALVLLALADVLGLLSAAALGTAMGIAVALVDMFSGSMIGLLVATYVRSQRAIQQLTMILGFGLSFFAPVYFPMSLVPSYLRPLTLLEPTTYMAQGLVNALGGHALAAFAWAVGAFAYGLISLAAARRHGL